MDSRSCWECTRTSKTVHLLAIASCTCTSQGRALAAAGASPTERRAPAAGVDAKRNVHGALVVHRAGLRLASAVRAGREPRIATVLVTIAAAVHTGVVNANASTTRPRRVYASALGWGLAAEIWVRLCGQASGFHDERSDEGQCPPVHGARFCILMAGSPPDGTHISAGARRSCVPTYGLVIHQIWSTSNRRGLS